MNEQMSIEPTGAGQTAAGSPGAGQTAAAGSPGAGQTAVAETAEFTVEGMTCGHCAKAVTDEVSKIEGVTGVDVDVASGRVRVASKAGLSRDDVAAAVDEAGYTLVAG